jgi:SAM-dependent methyltransferase
LLEPIQKNSNDTLRYPRVERSPRVPSLGWLYARHHARRFEWMRDKIASLGKRSISIIEIGCHDVRSLTYVPVNVHRYLGFDAGWQSGWKDGSPFGLEAGRRRLQEYETFEVRESTSPEDVEIVDEQFDLAIVLETFEYLDPVALESYVAALARKLRPDGCILSTMPNEKGFPLLLKAIGSKISGVRRSQYTVRQFCNALLGRMDRVPRARKGRRGFDYAQMVRLLRRYFPFMQLEGVGVLKLPPTLSTNIGIVAAKVPLPEPVSLAPSSTTPTRCHQ